MNKLLSIIQDENGQLSMIRVMGVVFCLSFIVEWQKYVWMGGEPPDINTLIATMATFGFKIIQKPFEKPK